MLVEGLVSTIIPVHNRPELLREAVNSVLAQSYRPIELIIIDDGSTDSTPEVAASMQVNHPGEIRVVRIANGGPGAARETGRQIACGEFIQYLDSDDLLSTDKFERQVSGLRKAQECSISYGQTNYGEMGAVTFEQPWKRTGEVIEALFPSMLISRWWGTSTPLYRRALTDRGGPWTTLRSEEDWEYDCRLARFGVRLHYCPTLVSTERSHCAPRLSTGSSKEVQKLADRAVAHELILTHAKAAGISPGTPEMQHFARELFLLARQCGAVGLEKESERLFRLARNSSLPEQAARLEFRLYKLGAQIIGWTGAGKIACQLDKYRK
jgi:glycosyltransferase involved in cell wall biosynthesis